MNIGSVPFRLCLHFVKSERGTALFCDQLSEMYGLNIQEMHMRLRSACAKGWIAKGRDGRYVYYSAGPKLLEAMQ
jgi:hypothetical protein